jgi:hypothetical protein
MAFRTELKFSASSVQSEILFRITRYNPNNETNEEWRLRGCYAEWLL